ELAAERSQEVGVGDERVRAGRAVDERLVQVPAAREEVRERRPAHERREEPTPLADRLHRAAEEDHRVRRGEALHRPVRELDLAGTPLILDRARRQTDVPEPVTDRLERLADAVEPRVGEELVATLEDLDLRRRTGLALACLVEPDLRTREARDVELDL